MKFSSKKLDRFGWFFLVLGLFILGLGILAVAQEIIYDTTQFTKPISFITQLIISGVFSMLSGIFLLDRTRRGIVLGLVTSGILIFLSTIIIFENNFSFSDSTIWSILPALFFIVISFTFILRVMKNFKQL
jgi:peptidoglycan/LPS O-acetylase OafA/YrhL